MLISTLAAMTAGYILSVIFGTPRAISAARLTGILCDKLAPALSGKYEDSDEGQHTAGVVYLTLIILVALVPSLLILILLYMYVPFLAIIADALLCWSVMDIKSIQKLSAAAARSVRSKNFSKTERCATVLSGLDCTELEDEELIKASVQGIADRTVDTAAAPLLYMFLLSGPAGLLFRMVDTAANLCPTDTDRQASFAEPLKKFQKALCFLPGKLASVIMLVDALFLKLNTRSAEKILRSDSGKCLRKCFGGCRAVLAGVLGISMIPEEVYSEQFLRTYTIGEQLKDPSSSDISMATQLMNGTVFIIMMLLFAVKLTVGIFMR